MLRFTLLLSLSLSLPMITLTEEANYDESAVPEFELPDPLVFEDGTRVKSARDWPARRAELIGLFEKHIYGKAPVGKPDQMWFETITPASPFLDGKATMEEIRIHFQKEKSDLFLELILFKPVKIPEAGHPTFLTLNFTGNHSLHPSAEITLTKKWMRESRSDREQGLVIENRSTEKSRGSRSHRWPVEKIIESGAALASFYYGDIDPDYDDGFENGIHAIYGKPKPEEWGSIASWAWGCSRAMDFLETDKTINSNRVAIMGHSRLGKTALWAGALDERFALVISNNSGCGGAALSKRCFGERVGRINRSFPHWFNDRFPDYNENEEALPVDQHQLLALIAPRKLYVASAVEDRWADPKGEFLASKHASSVYELLGKSGIQTPTLPPLNEPIQKDVSYHIREGKHDVTNFDWEQYSKSLVNM